eukprot:scaffold99995_cov36-Tisochrysis_lutea.AAC.3
METPPSCSRVPGGFKHKRTWPLNVSARCCIRQRSPFSPARLSRSSPKKARLDNRVAALHMAPKPTRRRDTSLPSDGVFDPSTCCTSPYRELDTSESTRKESPPSTSSIRIKARGQGS